MYNSKVNQKGKGIYGIYIDDELVYIGQTLTSFEKRFNQHRNNTYNENHKGQPLLYNTLRAAVKSGRRVRLIPLVDLGDLQVESWFTFDSRDLENMELALITVLQPRLNVQGKSAAYKF